MLYTLGGNDVFEKLECQTGEQQVSFDLIKIKHSFLLAAVDVVLNSFQIVPVVL